MKIFYNLGASSMSVHRRNSKAAGFAFLVSLWYKGEPQRFIFPFTQRQTTFASPRLLPWVMNTIIRVYS